MALRTFTSVASTQTSVRWVLSSAGSLQPVSGASREARHAASLILPKLAGEGSAAAERTAPTPRTIANTVTSGVAAMSTDSPLTITSTGTIESGNGVAVTGSGRNACGVTHSG